MILEIFLPEKLKGKRLLSRRVVGFSIQENTISATVSYITRSKSVVEKVLNEQIEPFDEKTYVKKVAKAAKKIIKKLGKYDHVRVTIPASNVVFKEITVPFVDADRIRMVMDYEVESMLPFPLENAVTDFVVIKQSKEEKTSTILVVAARVQDLENLIKMYQTAGIEPTHITVDVLSQYDLYHQIPEYKEIKKGSALIDLGSRTTRIAFLENGVLRLIRNIPRGIETIIENIAKDTNKEANEVRETLLKNGMQKVNDESYDKSLEKHFVHLFNDIQFTLNSFSLKLGFNDVITKLLFSGMGSKLNEVIKFASTTLQIPSEVFKADKVFVDKNVKNKVKPRVANWTPHTFSTACALPSEELIDFNLRRKSLHLAKTSLIQKQWLMASFLLVSLLSFSTITGYLQIANLTKAASTVEKKESKKLKTLFAKGSKALKKEMTFKKLVKAAEQAVSEKEELWAPFSQQRLRPLEILLELTRLIDKKRYDVSIDEIDITTEEGSPRIELMGFFRSKTGYHFQEFGVFQKTFHMSKSLMLVEEIDPTLADEKGVKFVVKLKQKEI